MPKPLPDQSDGEAIVIFGVIGMVFQVLSEEPMHMLKLPGPWIATFPALLDSFLNEECLPQMPFLRGL